MRSVLADAGTVHGDKLSFVTADLLSDDGWANAVADIDVVLHVASPVQPGHVASGGPSLSSSTSNLTLSLN